MNTFGKVAVIAKDADDDGINVSTRGYVPGDFNLLTLAREPGTTLAEIGWTPDLSLLGKKFKVKVYAQDNFGRPKRTSKVIDLRVLPESLAEIPFTFDIRKLEVDKVKYEKSSKSLTARGLVKAVYAPSKPLEDYQVNLFDTETGELIGSSSVGKNNGHYAFWRFEQAAAAVCEVLVQVDNQFVIKSVKGLREECGSGEHDDD